MIGGDAPTTSLLRMAPGERANRRRPGGVQARTQAERQQHHGQTQDGRQEVTGLDQIDRGDLDKPHEARGLGGRRARGQQHDPGGQGQDRRRPRRHGEGGRAKVSKEAHPAPWDC